MISHLHFTFFFSTSHVSLLSISSLVSKRPASRSRVTLPIVVSNMSFLSRILPSSEAFQSKDAFLNAIRVEDTLVVGDDKYVDPDPKYLNQGSC